MQEIVKNLREPFEPSGQKCPFCQSHTFKSYVVFAQDTDYQSEMTVLHCQKCDLAWQWPLHRDDDQSITYFESNYTTRNDGTYFDESRKKCICELEMKFLSSVVMAPGQLLDVGSGDGTFVEFAFGEGWSAYGVDPAGPNKQTNASDRKLCLVKGNLKKLDPGLRFDTVTMWDVIEHLDRPVELLRLCKEFLKPGGWLVVETGNFQSIGRILGGANWWCYQHDHRWYITPDTLPKILQLLGFVEFQICPRTLRPWVPNEGVYSGPTIANYILRTVKRPWTAVANRREFKQLATLARAHRDTAHLQIFALAARVPQ